MSEGTHAKARATLRVRDGVVLVGSDAHYWPGKPSTAHKAFVEFIGRAVESGQDIRGIVLNGDVLDFGNISKHQRIGWENQPGVEEQLSVAAERLAEIERQAIKYFRNTPLFWPLGNHDARFETRLATMAPEYRGVQGVHLKDHFPSWTPCWSLWINNDVVIKHRWKGGVNAAYNNAAASGKTVVTGHLHALGVSAVSDYSGTRWGVDCGTLADPYGPQFTDYTEDNPVNWRSGFVVLTFRGGVLLPPECVYVMGKNKVAFRGEIINV